MMQITFQTFSMHIDQFSLLYLSDKYIWRVCMTGVKTRQSCMDGTIWHVTLRGSAMEG